MQMNSALWARVLAFGLVVLIAMTTVLLVIYVHPLEIGLSHLVLFDGIVILGLMTNTLTGLVVSVVSIFIITLFNRYGGIYLPETELVNSAAELMAFFLAGPMAGRLGKIIGQMQRQANDWQAQAEAQMVHDKTFDTLKPAWAEVRLKEEMMRANQFSRPLSVVLLQVNPQSHVSTKVLHDRIAVLQAIIRLSRSLTQPPTVITCLNENEVLLILPEYTGEQAEELGQRLLDQSAHGLYFSAIETKSLGKAISQWGQVRIGVVSLNGHDTNAEMLLTQARFKLAEGSMKRLTDRNGSKPIQERNFVKLTVGQTPKLLASSDE